MMIRRIEIDELYKLELNCVVSNERMGWASQQKESKQQRVRKISKRLADDGR